jgi:hypothetical protein
MAFTLTFYRYSPYVTAVNQKMIITHDAANYNFRLVWPATAMFVVLWMAKLTTRQSIAEIGRFEWTMDESTSMMAIFGPIILRNPFLCNPLLKTSALIVIQSNVEIICINLATLEAAHISLHEPSGLTWCSRWTSLEERPSSGRQKIPRLRPRKIPGTQSISWSRGTVLVGCGPFWLENVFGTNGDGRSLTAKIRNDFRNAYFFVPFIWWIFFWKKKTILFIFFVLCLQSRGYVDVTIKRSSSMLFALWRPFSPYPAM